MVYHISIETTDTRLNKDIICLLTEYYNNLKYNTNTIIINDATHSLLPHEKVLTHAIVRSNNYHHTDHTQYDLVFWNNSRYTDIVQFKEYKSLTEHYITSINKHTPKPDIVFVILTGADNEWENEYTKLAESYTHIFTLPYSNHSRIITEINQILKKELTTCKYCGRIITPTQTLKKYCNKHCRNHERQIQNQQARRTYYKKYRHLLPPEQKNSIGTSNLTSNPETDFQEEQKKIQQEKRRLGI